VASKGVYYLNGVTGANVPNEISGFSVTHTQPSDDLHVFDVKLYNNGHERIKIKTHRDLVSVWVEKGKGIHFGDSVGLMGDFSRGRCWLLMAKQSLTIQMFMARSGRSLAASQRCFRQFVSLSTLR
jgi:hypothetical protein